jgi:hypothetical protein
MQISVELALKPHMGNEEIQTETLIGTEQAAILLIRV